MSRLFAAASSRPFIMGIDGPGRNQIPRPVVPQGFNRRVHTSANRQHRVFLGEHFDYGTTTGTSAFCQACVIGDNWDSAVFSNYVCHQVYFPLQVCARPTGYRLVQAMLQGKTWLPHNETDTRDTVVSVCSSLDELTDDCHVHVVHVCPTVPVHGYCKCQGYENYRPEGMGFIRSYMLCAENVGRSIIKLLDDNGSIYEVINKESPSMSWSCANGLFPDHEDTPVDEGVEVHLSDEYLAPLATADGWYSSCRVFRSGMHLQPAQYQSRYRELRGAEWRHINGDPYYLPGQGSYNVVEEQERIERRVRLANGDDPQDLNGVLSTDSLGAESETDENDSRVAN